MKILMISDCHIRSNSPEGRIDDFLKTQKEKWAFLLQTAKEEKVDFILQAGDLFEKPHPPISLLVEYIQLFKQWKIPIYCVYGQHDLAMRSTDVNRTAIGLLNAIGSITLLTSEETLFNDLFQDDIAVFGVSFGEDYNDLEHTLKEGRFPDTNTKILVVHDAIGNEPLFPGHKITKADKFLNMWKEFDIILCLTGDTKISLLDGRNVPIKNLVNEKFFVYSYDHYTNSIQPGYAHSCKKTKSNVPILKIELDDGEIIRCDYDERFLLLNGRYIQARFLKPGDSLMPLYRKLNDKGYEEILQPNNIWNKTHRIVYDWKYNFVPNKSLAHHKDFNKLNNSPDNILAMGWREHFLYHGKHASEQHLYLWKNPDYKKKQIIAFKKSWENPKRRKAVRKRWKDPKWRKKTIIAFRERGKRPEVREKHSLLNKKRVKNGTHHFVTNNPNIKRMEEGTHIFLTNNPSWNSKVNKIQSNTMLNLAKQGKHPAQIRMKEGTHNFIVDHPMKKPDIKFKVIRTRVKRVLDILKEKNLAINEENWEKNRLFDNTPNFQTALRYFEYKKEVINHKVVSVESDGYEDVYSFVVDRYHNFALSAGVFVHNCGDYHYDFIETDGERFIVNTGCLLRLQRVERDMTRHPHFYIYDTETKQLDKHYIPIRPWKKVFKMAIEKPEMDNREGLIEFIEKLKQSEKVGIKFADNLTLYFKENKTSKKVREKIDECFAEENTQ